MCRLVVYNYEPVASSAAHTTAAAWPCTIFSEGTSSTSHRGATTVTIVIAGTAFNSDIIRDTNSSSGTYGTSRSTSLTSTGSKRHSIADKGRISAIRSRPTRATQPAGTHCDGVRLAWFYRYFGANVRTRSASVRVATTATAAPYLYDDSGHVGWYGPSMRTDMSKYTLTKAWLGSGSLRPYWTFGSIWSWCAIDSDVVPVWLHLPMHSNPIG